MGTCPGTVTVCQELGPGAGAVPKGQDLEMCPGARAVPDLGAEFGDVQRDVLGEACGGGLWPVLTPRSRYWGAGVLWDLELPTQGRQW